MALLAAASILVMTPAVDGVLMYDVTGAMTYDMMMANRTV